MELKATKNYVLFVDHDTHGKVAGFEIAHLTGNLSGQDQSDSQMAELIDFTTALDTGFEIVEALEDWHDGEHASVHPIGPCKFVSISRDRLYTSIRLLREPDDASSFIELRDLAEQVSEGDEVRMIVILKGSFDTPERVAALKALGFEEISEEE